MLEACGIGYRYRGKMWLFRDINMRIQPGEIVGLFGPSGSGKTTLAKVMAGYLRPVEGYIVVDGQTSTDRYPFLKRRKLSLTKEKKKGPNPVQLIWQHPENAVNPRWRMSKTLAEAGVTDRHLLHTLGIHDEWLIRRPHELSGGELQRFCLARSLGPQTKYLIADEMTTMLDALTQAQIWHALLHIVKQRQIGLLVISHDKHLLHRISDRLINLNALAAQSAAQSFD